MKSILLFLTFFGIATAVNAQQFKLTDNGFVSSEDASKDYVVIDVPNTPQIKLYQKAKMYLNKLYNNPKFVSSEVENEQIVIDAIDADGIHVKFSMGDSNDWLYNYKYSFEFKDNKIKFTPYFKKLIDAKAGTEVELIGSNMIGTISGLYNKKGKCLKEKAVTEIEAKVDEYLSALVKALNDEGKSNDW